MVNYKLKLKSKYRVTDTHRMVESTNTRTYEVPFADRKHFSPEDCAGMANSFKNYDRDNSGTIDAHEFQQALKDMGHAEISEQRLASTFKEVDKDRNGVIDWIEFIQMMKHFKVAGQRRTSEQVNLKGLGTAQQFGGGGTSQSTYLLEEVSAIARKINHALKDEAALSDRLPIDPLNDDLFNACSDGLVLIYLLISIDPKLIDMKQVHHGQNVFKVRNNLDMAFAACKKTNIKVFGIDAQTFLDQTPNLILGIMWQVVRLLQVNSVMQNIAIGQSNINRAREQQSRGETMATKSPTKEKREKTVLQVDNEEELKEADGGSDADAPDPELEECQDIMQLAQDGEEYADLIKLPAEKLLVRWINFHLAAANQAPVGNLGKDLEDSKALIYLLNQLDAEKCSLEALDETDDLKRAEAVISNSKAFGVADLVGAADILKGNPKVNLIFISELFNTKPGLVQKSQFAHLEVEETVEKPSESAVIEEQKEKVEPASIEFTEEKKEKPDENKDLEEEPVFLKKVEEQAKKQKPRKTVAWADDIPQVEEEEKIGGTVSREANHFQSVVLSRLDSLSGEALISKSEVANTISYKYEESDDSDEFESQREMTMGVQQADMLN